MWELYVVITNIQRNKEQPPYLVSICSSTVLIMRDEEGNVITAGNIFYNNILVIVAADLCAVE